MIIPFGFGRGMIGRTLMKKPTSYLENELNLEPRNGCYYEHLALAIHKRMIKSILQHRVKQYGNRA